MVLKPSKLNLIKIKNITSYARQVTKTITLGNCVQTDAQRRESVPSPVDQTNMFSTIISTFETLLPLSYVSNENKSELNELV